MDYDARRFLSFCFPGQIPHTSFLYDFLVAIPLIKKANDFTKIIIKMHIKL
jgi:hypothetical protein